MQAAREPFTGWPLHVHLIADVLDLFTFIVWMADADVLEHDDLEDPASVVIVIGIMVPLVGWLLERHCGDGARKLYIHAELIFDLAEILFVAAAKQRANVKEKHFIVLVLTMLSSAIDALILKGPEVLRHFSPDLADRLAEMIQNSESAEAASKAKEAAKTAIKTCHPVVVFDMECIHAWARTYKHACTLTCICIYIYIYIFI